MKDPTMNYDLEHQDIDLDHAQRIAEFYGLRVRATPDGGCVLDDPLDNQDPEMRREGSREFVLGEFLRFYPDLVDDFDEVAEETRVPSCPHLLAAINAILASDDKSTDAQLIATFSREFGLSDQAAAMHVQRRDEMLSGIPCAQS
jgi:hypothetical protein